MMLRCASLCCSLVVVLGFLQPQHAPAAEQVRPEELGLALKVFPRIKAITRVSFEDRAHPERSRQQLTETYYFPDALILHYKHDRGETVVVSDKTQSTYDYWTKGSDPFVGNAYEKQRLPAELGYVIPYRHLYSLVNGVTKLEPDRKVSAERGGNLTTVTVTTAGYQPNVERVIRQYVIDGGRLVSKVTRVHYQSTKLDGKTYPARTFTFQSIAYADFHELPDGSSLPRTVVFDNSETGGWHVTCRVEELTLLPESLSSRDVVRQLTAGIPHRTPPQPFFPVKSDRLANNSRTLARALFTAAVALLAAVWFVFRLRGRRI